MSKLIPVNKELPIREIKPAGEWFSDEEYEALLGPGTISFITWTEEAIIAHNEDLTEPVNERACTLLHIPTIGELRQIMIANGKPTDQLPADDSAPAYQIFGDAIILDYDDFEGWDDDDGEGDDNPPPSGDDLFGVIQGWLNGQRQASPLLVCR